MSTQNIHFYGELEKNITELSSKVLLMSTNKICFHGEIRKISVIFNRKKVPCQKL